MERFGGRPLHSGAGVDGDVDADGDDEDGQSNTLKKHEPTRDDLVGQAFQLLDIDHDGVITAEDILVALPKVWRVEGPQVMQGLYG